MPQQINLCTPLLLAPKRYFSAQTMVQALAIFIVLGGGGSAAWVWSLNRNTADIAQLRAGRATELANLQSAISVNIASAAPLNSDLQSQVQGLRNQVIARERVLQALKEGRVFPGAAHSDRLVLVSRSIPGSVWLTAVDADATHFEAVGYTLDPAALNQWVSQLALSPITQGLRLSTVKVQSARAGTTDPATLSGVRETWSFSLASAQPRAPVTSGAGDAP